MAWTLHEENYLGHQDINVLGLELLLVDHHVYAEDEGEDPLVLLVQRPVHLKKKKDNAIEEKGFDHLSEAVKGEVVAEVAEPLAQHL